MQGKIDRITDGVIRGWLRDAKRPGQRLVAEILIDGVAIGGALADRRRGDLVDARIGDGLHGFEMPMPEAIDQTKPLQVTMQTQFGGASVTIDERHLTPHFAKVSVNGKLEGIQSGAIVGWAWDKKHPSRRLTVLFYHNGNVIAEIVARKKRSDLVKAGIGDGEHGFAKLLSELPLNLGETPVLEAFALDDKTPVPIGTLALASGWRPAAPAPAVVKPADPPLAPQAETKPKRVENSSPPESAKAVAEKPAKAPVEASAAPVAPAKAVAQPPKAEKPPAVSAMVKVAIPAPAAKPSSGTAVHASPNKALNIKDEIAKSSAAESKGSLAEAHAILETILAVDPKNTEALFRRARVALSMGNVQEAKQFATAAVERSKDHPKAHVTLARVAEMEGQRNLALEYWTKVPKNESAYRERLLKSGRILAALERPREGLASLIDAVALKPEDVAARKSLLRLARDINDLPLAEEQRQALVKLGSPATETSLMPKVLSHSESVMRRYGGAMSRMQDPIVLGVGSDLQACLIGGLFATALATYFDTQIDVVVPETTAATNLLLKNNKSVRRMLTAAKCNAVYELAILLPEFALSVAEELPRATLCYSFVETHSLAGSALHDRLGAYRSWLSGITGAPQQIFDEASLAIPESRSAKRAGPVLLLERKIKSEWPGFQALFDMLAGRGYQVTRIDASKALHDPAALGGLLKGISGAGAVITADETLGALAAVLNAPVVFATAANSGDILRQLAAGAVIVSAAQECGGACGDTPATRWKAAVGACECLKHLAAGAVMEALEGLSIDTVGAQLLPAAAAAE